MSAADVGKIEAGRVVPYPSQLNKLAKALGLRLQDPEVLLEAESGDE
jgi:ribosome-binding protein aMBF1 (putative translation factor)